MIKPLKVIISFFGLNGQIRKDVVGLFIIYLKVSWLIRYYPLRKYYNTYFLHDHIHPFDFAPYKKELNLVRKVIKHMPGNHTCLKESIIVHEFFKRKGLNVPIYLGVKTENGFLAHAWYDQSCSHGFNRVNAV